MIVIEEFIYKKKYIKRKCIKKNIMTKLIIDNRERRLYEEIKSRDLEEYEIEISEKQLEIGDIIIENEKTKILFERKTNQDLLASIKDGRFREQKVRMMSSEYKINYIIENSYIIQYDNICEGAILNTLFRDNINVIFTKNLVDTASIILRICVKLCKKPECFVSNEINEYISNTKVKSKKIENIDKETCFILQLCQIPYISEKIARRISERHKSMKELINYLDECEDKVKYLESIEKIGEKKAKMIIDMLN